MKPASPDFVVGKHVETRADAQPFDTLEMLRNPAAEFRREVRRLPRDAHLAKRGHDLRFDFIVAAPDRPDRVHHRWIVAHRHGWVTVELEQRGERKHRRVRQALAQSVVIANGGQDACPPPRRGVHGDVSPGV